MRQAGNGAPLAPGGPGLAYGIGFSATTQTV